MKRCGILLINLGTPAAPTPHAIRHFLAEFLRDRRVVQLSRWLWLPLLYLLILPFRPKRLVPAYQKIWTAEGSPLLVISRRQAIALQKLLVADGISVRLAMRYGGPDISAAITDLQATGIERVLAFPLYPQYSGAGTASAQDAVDAALQRRAAAPELRFVEDYHDHPAYIAALAASVQSHWASNGRGGHLIMSFHSIPQAQVDAGDPYRTQCERTAQLLAQRLELGNGDWTLCFQSRLGSMPWLQPYTDVVLQNWQGARTVDVIAPGFSADCLETLEEIAIRYAGLFRASCGGELRYIPALNDSPAHIDALAAIARQHLQRWC